jgi:hypothetical protein
MSGRSSRTAAEFFPCTTPALCPGQLIGDVIGRRSPVGLRPGVQHCHQLVAVLLHASVRLPERLELALRPFESALQFPLLAIELPQPSDPEPVKGFETRAGLLALNLGFA